MTFERIVGLPRLKQLHYGIPRLKKHIDVANSEKALLRRYEIYSVTVTIAGYLHFHQQNINIVL